MAYATQETRGKTARGEKVGFGSGSARIRRRKGIRLGWAMDEGALVTECGDVEV
jgi:hypothetical protein